MKNQMLYCGRIKNNWVEKALEYLPDEIFNKISGKIAITVLNSDACRLAKKISEHDEIIILSPWIFSYIPAGSCEADNEWRYFIFCVLHEIAHAVLKHSPPDELSNEKNEDQEKEADKFAIEWFNSHVIEKNNTYLNKIDINEIRLTQKNYKKKTEQILSIG